MAEFNIHRLLVALLFLANSNFANMHSSHKNFVEAPENAEIRLVPTGPIIPGFSQSLLQSPNFHVLALAPYQISTVSGTTTVTGKAQIEAQKADTVDIWLGYPRVAFPNINTPCDAENKAKSCKICVGTETVPANADFVCCNVGGTCITSFQAAVYGLLQDPLGGQYIPTTKSYGWNGPATGGVMISVFGMGFGWNSVLCQALCMQNPTSYQYCGQDNEWPCTYVSAVIGNTQAGSSGPLCAHRASRPVVPLRFIARSFCKPRRNAANPRGLPTPAAARTPNLTLESRPQ